MPAGGSRLQANTRRDRGTTCFAAVPPLEAEKALFALVAGAREKRRERGLAEVKLMFDDVKKAHLNARCVEEEWVELPDECEEQGTRITKT